MRPGWSFWHAAYMVSIHTSVLYWHRPLPYLTVHWQHPDDPLARRKGVLPVCILWFTRISSFFSNIFTFYIPSLTSNQWGLSPLSGFALFSISGFSNNKLTTSAWPRSQAMISGVLPSMSALLISISGLANSAFTIFIWAFKHAIQSGVTLSFVTRLILISGCCSSAFTMSKLPLRHAMYSGVKPLLETLLTRILSVFWLLLEPKRKRPLAGQA